MDLSVPIKFWQLVGMAGLILGYIYPRVEGANRACWSERLCMGNWSGLYQHPFVRVSYLVGYPRSKIDQPPKKQLRKQR
jgi:hypothetical protein